MVSVKLLIIALVACFQIRAAIVRVNVDTAYQPTSGTSIASAGISHTAGNALVVVISKNGGTVATSVTNTAGDLFVLAHYQLAPTFIGDQMIYVTPQTAGNATDVVTVTFASATARAITVLQYSGCDPTSPLDDIGLATNTTNSNVSTISASVSTVASASVIIGAFAFNGGTGTPGSGFTTQSNLGTGYVEDQIFSTKQTGLSVSATWTPSSTNGACVTVIALVPPRAMAIVTKAEAHASSGASVASPARSHTTGNALVVFVYSNDTTKFVSLADTAGNHFYLIDHEVVNGVGHASIWVYVARNIIGNASNVVTATFAGSVSLPLIFVNEYSGVALIYALDGWSFASVPSTTIGTPTLTTSYPNSIVVLSVGSWNSSNVFSSTGTMTIENTSNTLAAISDQIFSSTGSFGPGMNASNGGQLLAIAVVLAGTGQSPTYTYIRPLTVSHASVGAINNTDQANFPTLINSTWANLATIANGGNIQNTATINGVTVPADLAYSTDPTCANTMDSTGLDFEHEAYSATAGSKTDWVSRTLSHSVDTPIYQCFGSCQVKNSPSIGSAVWENAGGFSAVYHYSPIQKQCTTVALPMFDSTSNGNYVCANSGGSSGPTNNAGEVSNGLDFTVGGVNTGFNTTSSPVNLSIGTNPWTIESWLFMPTGMSSGEEAFGWGDNGGTGHRIAWYWQTPNSYIECSSCSTGVTFTPDSVWHHWAATLPSGTTDASIKLYKDGVNVSPVTGSGGTLNVQNTTIAIGTIPNTNFSPYWPGKLDESRISNVARSADWINTTWNCGGKTCYTVGTLTINGAAICPGITGNQRSFSYVTELFPMEFPWEQTCSKLSNKGAL